MKHIATLILIILYSCNYSSKGTPENSGNYFITIYNSLGEFKTHHNKFSDKCTGILDNILYDNFKTTDTIGLSLLLDNAKTSQIINLKIISKLKEIDTIINLKAISIDYLTEAKNYYDNYYNKFLSLTKEPRDADSVTTLHTISKEIKLLVHKDSVCIEAYKSFKKKYDIQTLN